MQPDAYGIMNPLIVMPTTEMFYRIISGHRRKYCAEKLGYTKVPVIIRYMKEDDSIISMVDSNLHREKLLFSEKAWAYKMKMDAMKRQGARTDLDLDSESASTQKGWRSETAVLIGEQVGESKNQVRRYIRLTELISELLEYLDLKRIQFTSAVEISYLDKEIQKWLFEYIRDNGLIKPKQIALLREACKTGIMTEESPSKVSKDVEESVDKIIANRMSKAYSEWKSNQDTQSFNENIEKEYQKLLETLSPEQEKVLTKYCDEIFASGAEIEEFFYRLGIKDGLRLKSTVKSVLEMMS